MDKIKNGRLKHGKSAAISGAHAERVKDFIWGCHGCYKYVRNHEVMACTKLVRPGGRGVGGGSNSLVYK